MNELTIFGILATITVLTAFMVIFSKNPVHSILYLVLCFFSIAGHYVMLNAQFLAVVQVIVYAGAVMVLFLFVVMMLNLNKDSEPKTNNLVKVMSVIAGASLMLVLLAALKDAQVVQMSQQLPENFGNAKSVGEILFSKYVIPFEVSSILFISAMVGAVILGKKHVDD